MADCKPNHTCATATLLFSFLCLQFPPLPVAGEAKPYTPTDNIVIDCGSPHNSSVLGDDRPWLTDLNSKFFPSNLHHNRISVIRPVHTRSPPVPEPPYRTARLSRSDFTYSFPVTPGQKFIRLYFYSANYSYFQRSKAVFSVKTGAYTLLRDYDASLNADSSHGDGVFLEFCVYVEPIHQKLNLTFTPTNPDSYAFINGIEILSMPSNLYYTPPDPNHEGGRGLRFLGQNNQFFPIENYTSLQMLYRINIGGKFISSKDDTGMFRTWSEEEAHYVPDSFYDARPANLSIQLHYNLILPSTAPEDVYRTARTMGPNATENKSYNLTWEYLVDPGFIYMLRLHFCEIQSEINDPNDRVFLIHINDIIAEPNADVIRWAGGKGIPIYRDYVVLLSHTEDIKKVNLSVKLQANPDDSKTRFTNVILNGIEIFKLNDSSGNLAGKTPDSPTQYLLPLIPQTENSSNRKMVAIVISTVVGGVALISALCLFVYCRRTIFSDQTPKDGASSWAPYSISTNKSSQACSSNVLPSDLCRYFTLSEIQAATNNFDNILTIGVGRYGIVYKGYIDDGVTQVAIKRLKPSSKQGAHEFKTEIEMLSKLCHLHLVSLIGYCNDGNEMILVYDYMSHGTLRSHLYGGDKQPLKWKRRLQICIGSARGLHYLHTGTKHTIIHRDVKTTNILLDDKYVAKVFYLKLSKLGLTNMSMAHISTMVKDSFSYLDPEYYRRQQLTEKSDVYSFGVVLCEVLCARPPLKCDADKNQVYLAEWVQRCYRDNAVSQIVDPNIKSEISPKCLRKFVEIAVSCIEDNGKKRPAMNDVVWGLEFALQLQEASTKTKVDKDDEKGDGEEELLIEDQMLFSCSGDGCSVSDTGISRDLTTSNSDDSSYGYNKRMLASVFSEIKDPAGR